TSPIPTASAAALRFSSDAASCSSSCTIERAWSATRFVAPESPSPFTFSSLPRPDGSEPRSVSEKSLARRRRLVRLELLVLLAVDPEMHGALLDLADLLGRHVERPVEDGAGADGETVEDVGLGVTEDLAELADLVPVVRDDTPARLCDLPGNGIGHQAGRRPTRKFAPWVPTG